ncbi:MAG: hypothetical protein HYR56_07390 [Acidobacteria bacterium]|nr:hypothetical protein [Acidobacteriota bacterium]MBI3425152.1 hypothetical protein [Acidobacteriota bacterium]
MLTEDADNKDYVTEYLKLKTANDQFRERGKQWLWELLEKHCAEINRQLASPPDGQPDGQILQSGRQPWQFEIQTDAGKATMAGERFGVRYRGQTFIIEVGWPQLPEHGFIPAGGLARGRVRFSPNVMLEPQTKAELVLKCNDTGVVWYELKYKQLGPAVTEAYLRQYLDLVLKF